MTNLQTAAALLFQFAGIQHANDKLCSGFVALAADQFSVEVLGDLDEQQITDIVDMLQDSGDDHRDEY